MTVRFNLGNRSYKTLVKHFGGYLFSQPIRNKDKSITLGALTFYPDGTMTSPVGTENIVMKAILEDLDKKGITYEIL